MAQRLPFLRWIRPRPKQWRQDFFAALTVGLMLVPQAIAYAALAGMPLEAGLYAAILPLALATLLASSPRLGTGPTALTALMVSAALAPLAQPGSAQWVTLAIWLALLSGAIQLAMGLLRMDWLQSIITVPVLSGFSHAAALLIIGSQIPTLTGVPWSTWRQALQDSAGLEALLASIDGYALLFSSVAIAAFLGVKRLGHTIPWTALILAVGATAAWLLGYADHGSAVIGPLSLELHSLHWPPWPGSGTVLELLVPALLIALISFVEAAASAKTEHALAGTPWQPAQDLIAQGVAKIASGLAGGFPISASFSRSAVIHYAGAQTGWVNLWASLLVLIVALWFAPLLAHVPMALLAALVVVSVYGLLKPRTISHFWAFSRIEAGIAVLTLVVTLLSAPHIYWGVLAGLLANLAYFMHQHLRPRIVEVGLFPEDGRLRDRFLWQLEPLSPYALALRLDGPLDFATASALERRVTARWEADAQLHSICLIASSIHNIDTTGLEALFSLRNMAGQRGGKLYLSGMKLPLEQRLRHIGLLSDTHRVQAFPSDAETVRGLAQLQAQ